MLPDLSPAELRRYARHLTLPEIGLEGQRRLRDGSVLVVGAGGLGSPAALYLAAAGVGRLGIVDGDRVDESNLQRQVLHGTADVGRAKTASAAERLHDLNPHVVVEPHQLQLDAGNAGELVARYDVVVDGTDNFATRYVLSDACVALAKPCVHASIHRFEGQATVLVASGAPCYRCLFREPPPAGTAPSCAEAGVLGVLPGMLGTMQAAEAIKLLTGVGHTLAGRLVLVDLRAMRFQEIALRRDPGCLACGDRARAARGGVHSPEASRAMAATRGGPPPGSVSAPDDEAAPDDLGPDHSRPPGHRADGGPPPRPTSPSNAPAAQPHGRSPDHSSAADMDLPEIAPRELAERLRAGDSVDLLDVREPWEHAAASIPGARLVPLGQLEQLAHTIAPDREVVVLCHHGVRSAAAVDFLREIGVRGARNLAGGIDRWSREVDPSVPRY